MEPRKKCGLREGPTVISQLGSSLFDHASDLTQVVVPLSLPPPSDASKLEGSRSEDIWVQVWKAPTMSLFLPRASRHSQLLLMLLALGRCCKRRHPFSDRGTLLMPRNVFVVWWT